MKSLLTSFFILTNVLIAASSAEPVRLRDVLIKGVPHVVQKPDFCGEACAEMFLRKLGKRMDQDYVFDQSGLDPNGTTGLCIRT